MSVFYLGCVCVCFFVCLFCVSVFIGSFFCRRLVCRSLKQNKNSILLERYFERFAINCQIKNHCFRFYGYHSIWYDDDVDEDDNDDDDITDEKDQNQSTNSMAMLVQNSKTAIPTSKSIEMDPLRIYIFIFILYFIMLCSRRTMCVCVWSAVQTMPKYLQFFCLDYFTMKVFSSLLIYFFFFFFLHSLYWRGCFYFDGVIFILHDYNVLALLSGRKRNKNENRKSPTFPPNELSQTIANTVQLHMNQQIGFDCR